LPGTARYDCAVPDFDVDTPHIARIYDCWLGGTDNFGADRSAATSGGVGRKE
jgi:S-adenosyl methyltransferase